MGIPTKVPIDLVNPTPAASTDLSDYVTLDSTQTISGGKTLTNGLDITNNDVRLRHPITKGTSPEETIARYIWFGGSSSSTGYSANSLGMLANEITDQNKVTTFIRAVKNESSSSAACSISVNVDANGNSFTYAPTPATNDNSTKIATTAFVNNRLPYETGTWTPTLSGSTTAGAFTYSYTPNDGGCYYVKLGHLVFLRAAFTYKITTAPSGEVRINGAPFVSNSYYSGVGGGNNRRWDSCQIPFNASYVRPRAFNSSTGVSPVVSWGSSDGLGTWINTVNSNDWIIFSIWYMTNS